MQYTPASKKNVFYKSGSLFLKSKVWNNMYSNIFLFKNLLMFDIFLRTWRQVENVMHSAIHVAEFRKVKVERYEKIIHFSFTSLDCCIWYQ